MNTTLIIICVVGFIVFILLLWVLATYNKLVKMRNKVRDQWSQVDVQLKKRFDLIPNIVNIVKGYATHEEETLKSVIEARNAAISTKNPTDELKENDRLTENLSKLFVLSESYPDLKANENFKLLQFNLTEVEDKIAYARQFYNDTVLAYKNCIETFPTLLIAGMLGFKQENFFTAKEEEKENVETKF